MIPKFFYLLRKIKGRQELSILEKGARCVDDIYTHIMAILKWE